MSEKEPLRIIAMNNFEQHKQNLSKVSKESLEVSQQNPNDFSIDAKIVKLNGKPVVITQSKDGFNAYDLQVLDTPQNQIKDSRTNVDWIPFIILGSFLGLLAFGLIGIFSRSPQPYYTEREICRPSGFLWLNKECHRTYERGYR